MSSRGTFLYSSIWPSSTDDRILTEINRIYTQFSHPDVAGEIYPLGGGEGGMFVGGKFGPIVCTPRQIEAITTNEWLGFREEPDSGQEGVGYIQYKATSREQRLNELTKICDWYNTARQEGGYDPYWLAATLERKIISVHPWRDGNGGTARGAMNWSLELDRRPRCAPLCFDDDLLLPETDWAKAVKDGCELYDSFDLQTFLNNPLPQQLYDVLHLQASFNSLSDSEKPPF